MKRLRHGRFYYIFRIFLGIVEGSRNNFLGVKPPKYRCAFPPQIFRGFYYDSHGT